MAIVVKSKKGKNVTLLNPAERAEKFALELETGKKQTNNGEWKKKNGQWVELTKTEAAFRSGYLQARKDNAKAYKSKKRSR